MNKTEFVGRVAEKGDMSGAEAGRAVQAVLDVIQDALKSGEDRLFSSYQVAPGLKLWIITEWDRSVTTLLLPSEY